MQRQPATIIEIRPFRNAWQVFEAPGVQPVFLTKEQAIDYAQNRACFRSGEIREEGVHHLTVPCKKGTSLRAPSNSPFQGEQRCKISSVRPISLPRAL
jgi:hypothetical protein